MCTNVCLIKRGVLIFTQSKWAARKRHEKIPLLNSVGLNNLQHVSGTNQKEHIFLPPSSCGWPSENNICIDSCTGLHTYDIKRESSHGQTSVYMRAQFPQSFRVKTAFKMEGLWEYLCTSERTSKADVTQYSMRQPMGMLPSANLLASNEELGGTSP